MKMPDDLVEIKGMNLLSRAKNKYGEIEIISEGKIKYIA